MSTPATRLLLEWEAATLPRLFPLMEAERSLRSLPSPLLSFCLFTAVGANGRFT
jgi:hypothetical protein